MLGSMNRPIPRPEVAALPPYVPGARGDAGPAPIKLSSNESPFVPLPSVTAAIADAARTINRYPDMFATAVTARIAESVGQSPDRVVVGAGSVAVLAHVLQAYCGAGDEVVFAWRSFEAYPILVSLVGGVPVRVPLTAEARHDFAGMAGAVTERTRVVLLCSPNNPTGPSIRTDEFETFMAAVPSHVLVVLDEAYVEFVRDADTVDGLQALTRHDNLLVLRTFSKAYGLAGMRVGFAMGSAELIAPVRSCVTPFSITDLAGAAAVASLDARDELLERVARTVEERARVLAAVRELGWNAPDAEGNFVWLPAGERTGSIAAALGSLVPQILVRPFAGEGIRVTIGTREENDAMLAALPRAAVDDQAEA